LKSACSSAPVSRIGTDSNDQQALTQPRAPSPQHNPQQADRQWTARREEQGFGESRECVDGGWSPVRRGIWLASIRLLLLGFAFDSLSGGFEILAGAFDRIAAAQGARCQQERAQQQDRGGECAFHGPVSSNQFMSLENYTDPARGVAKASGDSAGFSIGLGSGCGAGSSRDDDDDGYGDLVY